MRLIASTFVMVLTSGLVAQVVGEATFCENVVSLNAVNPKSQFASGQKAYLWMRINEATPGTSITVDWMYNNRVEHSTKLSLAYASMRTYAFKTLAYDGTWTAVVRASDGRELKRLTCTAGSGSTAQTASSTGTTSAQPVNPVSTAAASKGSSTVSTAKADEVKPAPLTLDPAFDLEIKQSSRILTPAKIQNGKSYPVLVFLPPTGMTAEELFENYTEDAGQNDHPLEKLLEGLFPNKLERSRKEFFVLLPAGEGSAGDHSWQGFHACIHRYEQRVIRDIRILSKKYNIDTTKIVLTGYSLGGDLGWAIAHRHPYSFKGGIISESRIAYHEPGKLEHLAKNKARFYLAMGEFESETRRTVFDQTRQLLDKHGVVYKSVVIKDGEHSPMIFDQLREGINYVMFDESQ